MVFPLAAQDFLPPVSPWKGKSEKRLRSPNDPWACPIEKSGFLKTPTLSETYQWFNKLDSVSPWIHTRFLGESDAGNPLQLVIASLDANVSPEALRASGKPCILVQAGIHSGEIDGKDAGMLLLRDLVYLQKKEWLENVHFLFVPVLNPDGHEMASAFNRPNQRGPSLMGWRTNGKNLNLNRDYTVLATKEIGLLVQLFKDYDPDFFVDIHVTDGSDYQYDLTWQTTGAATHAPAGMQWLENKLMPDLEKKLKAAGHVPGPFQNPAKGNDFRYGLTEYAFGPNFSHPYADLRKVPAMLIENHSLKPYRQRVLATVTFLEGLLELVGKNYRDLLQARQSDLSRITDSVVLSWKNPDVNRQVDQRVFHLGKKSRKVFSPLLGDSILKWMVENENREIPFFKVSEKDRVVARPKGYWIPAAWKSEIQILKGHGLNLDTGKEAGEIPVQVCYLRDPVFSRQPIEGRFHVDFKEEWVVEKIRIPKGYVFVSAQGGLGDLAVMLLEPGCPESLVRMGGFPSIFHRTEYMESYAIEPMAKLWLEQNPEIKSELERKKASEPEFRSNPGKILEWLYRKSPYADKAFQRYPVLRQP